VISTRATGPGCIIQSDFRGGDHGNFEVVVPLDDLRLHHVFHDNAEVAAPWRLAQRVTTARMHVFFTTDHVHDPDGLGDSMGRSILARSDDGGINFGSPIYTMSTNKFINMSVQVVDNEQFQGLPTRSGQGLVIWGSGGYRRSNVYLAHVPLDAIEDHSSLHYFAGFDERTSTPRWTDDEALAVPLFLSGSVGELSVRWNPPFSKFILTYNSDNPPSILERQSSTPWGPWTNHENIWDWNDSVGYLHRADSHDGLSDPGREGEGGGAYGPYLIGRYTRPLPDGSTRMYFLLSVWNPYNTMLMAAAIRDRQ
jgi:hypothetical protein